MFRKKITLPFEPIELAVFNPNKEDDKKEFKSHIQKPKRKVKSQVLNSSTIL